MGFAPGWPPGGAEPYCPAAGRRAASGSPSRCHRSTGAPDAIGAHAAGPPARARVRYPPLPHLRPTSPPRAPGYDLDRQFNGPATGGTPCPEVPVLRGGPQSFAAPAAGDLAAGHPGPPSHGRSGDPRPARGLPGRLRRASVAVAGVAQRHARFRMTDGAATADTPADGRGGDSRLPAVSLSAAPPELPVYSLVLPVRTGGGDPPRCSPRELARRSPAGPLPSVSSGWLRSRSLIR